MVNQPIKILGAGPAGLSAAIVLAKNNYDVTVFEKNSCVGARFNYDFQGIENWSSESDVLEEFGQLNLDTDFNQIPYKEFTILMSSGRSIVLRSIQPMFYLIHRGSKGKTLDQSLLDQALRTGVNVCFNSPHSLNDVDIVATGPVGRPDAIARGVTFDLDYKKFGAGTLIDNLSPGGYTYFFSFNGTATLATVLFRNFKENKICLDKTIDYYEKILGIKVKDNIRLWGGRGNFIIPQTAVSGGKLYVGEAAGFQDKLFGFGIRYAITSGVLAAQSIIYKQDYDRLWKERFSRMMKASNWNRKIYKMSLRFSEGILWRALRQIRDGRSALRKIYLWPSIR